MTDQELIQGTWKLESITSGGEPVGAGGIIGCKIHGNQMDELLGDEDGPESPDAETVCEFTLQSDTAPKRIVAVTNWHDENGPYPPHTQKGFYELSADTLRILWGPDEFPIDCPEEFCDLYVYRRAES